MSTIGAAAAKAKRESEATVKVPEARDWRGFVVRIGAHGTEWAKVAIPEHVLRQYVVGSVQPPDLRGIVAARIETELSGDAIVEGRGWPK